MTSWKKGRKKSDRNSACRVAQAMHKDRMREIKIKEVSTAKEVKTVKVLETEWIRSKKP